jgi:hypothetical protein
MHAFSRRLASFLLILAAALPFWACGITAQLEGQVNPHLPKGFVKTSATAVGGRNCGKFTQQCGTATLSGTATLRGTVGNRDTTITVAVTLSASGPAGADYCLDFSDPILVQLPGDATNIAGTYTSLGAGESGALIVTSGLLSVPTSPTTSLSAEPGQQLVLIATRDSIPGDDYAFALSFDLAVSRPIDTKLAILGKVQCGDLATYYPPVVPCGLSSMSELPPVTIPQSETSIPLSIPLDGMSTACLAGAGCFSCPLVGVDEGHRIDPRLVTLYNPAPTPTRAGTTVRYTLLEPARVSLLLYDSRGRIVRELQRGTMPNGQHAVTWDGLDARGHHAAPGMYFVRLLADGRQVGEKRVVKLP